MKNKPHLQNLFQQCTGRTTTHPPVIAGNVSPRDVARMQGYWVDRTNRFKGW